MSQTLALFVDAYRDLNARKLFWITLILSGVVMAGFAMVGVGPAGVSILHWEIPRPPFSLSPLSFYRFLFTQAMIGFWLAWAQIILALVSTCGIFPDFIVGGSIDLFLSKPIGRLRLFLTKYFAALLFVALQVTVFSIGAFLVFGIRAHSWEPRLFLAIPIILAVFSYLFGFCVLVGVVTRSSMTAVLVTMLFWFLLWGLQRAETVTLAIELEHTQRADRADAELRALDQRAKSASGATTSPASGPSVWQQLNPLRSTLRSTQGRDQLLEQRTSARAQANSVGWWHRLLYNFRSVLPKTTETANLLDRELLSPEDEVAVMHPPGQRRRARLQGEDNPAEELVATLRTRSLGWIVGTSLAFEAVCLTLAAWLFCRRDY